MQLKRVLVIAAVMSVVLYTVAVGAPSLSPVALIGRPLPFGLLVGKGMGCCNIASVRARLTSIITTLLKSAPEDVVSFEVTEKYSAERDAEALLVHSLPSRPVVTAGIFDRYAHAFGDGGFFDVAEPFGPAATGFLAGMRLGTGFSCHGPSCGDQPKTPEPGHGGATTNDAGNNSGADQDTRNNRDAGVDMGGASIADGGFDDPFLPKLPPVEAHHEAHDFVPQTHDGDTFITVVAADRPEDDNLFLATIYGPDTAEMPQVTSPLAADPVPEPATLSLLGLGMAGAWLRRRARKSSPSDAAH